MLKKSLRMAGIFKLPRLKKSGICRCREYESASWNFFAFKCEQLKFVLEIL